MTQDDEQRALEACPFCGSSELLYRNGRIRCYRCLAQGPWTHLRMEYAARDKWNNRESCLQSKASEGAVAVEPDDAWAERYCSAVNWCPDGTENKYIEGVLLSITFRELAKGHIKAVINTAPKASEGAGDELGWCLEKDATDGPMYLTISNGLLGWSKPNENLKALRFARRADAEMICEIVEDADRIAEHMWCAPKPPEPKP